MIDRKNFSILKTLEESDKPSYKSDIQRKMKRKVESLPIDDYFSVQTVCRRVGELEEDGYVEPTIIKSENTNRVFIKAYQLTEKGEKQIEEFRENFLLNTVSEYISSCLRPDKEEPNPEEEVVREIVSNTFGIPDEECLEDMECVLSAVALYYSRREIHQSVEEPVFQEFAERVSAHNQEFAESLMSFGEAPGL